MKSKLRLLFFTSVVCNCLLGQNLELSGSDTLNFYYKTGGSIDTFDLTYTFQLSTLPSGGFNRYNQTPNFELFRSSSNLFQISRNIETKKWKYSGLPHIGFFYSFGSKGTQFIHADYQQAFSNGSELYFSLDQDKSNGVTSAGQQVNNSRYSNQNLFLGYKYNKNKLEIEFSGKFNTVDQGLSGGFSDTTNLLGLGIEFGREDKNNANSIQKVVFGSLDLQYNLLKDTIRQKLGFYLNPSISILNRVYEESSDSLWNLYTNVFIDSFSTRDQFQESKLRSAGGIFYSNAKLKIKSGLAHRYWRFQNLGTNRDSNEINVDAGLTYMTKNFQLKSTNTLNLIGAENEFSSRSNLFYNLNRTSFGASLHAESILPELVQRAYFANNISFTQPTLEKQNRYDIHVSAKQVYKSVEGQIELGQTNWSNNLIWQNLQWTKTNLTINYLKFRFGLNYKWLVVLPEIQLMTGTPYLPNYLFSSRFAVKTKLFKAKKLELLFAIDPQINSSYQLMSYNTLLDNWGFDATNRIGGQRFVLHSTVSIGIEEFRFFFRAENIHAIWTKNDIEVAQNYFIPPFLFRLGLSWDFFN